MLERPEGPPMAVCKLANSWCACYSIWTSWAGIPSGEGCMMRTAQYLACSELLVARARMTRSCWSRLQRTRTSFAVTVQLLRSTSFANREYCTAHAAHPQLLGDSSDSRGVLSERESLQWSHEGSRGWPSCGESEGSKCAVRWRFASKRESHWCWSSLAALHSCMFHCLDWLATSG